MKTTKQDVINELINIVQQMFKTDSGVVQKVIKGLNKMAYHEVNNLLFLIKLTVNIAVDKDKFENNSKR